MNKMESSTSSGLDDLYILFNMSLNDTLNIKLPTGEDFLPEEFNNSLKMILSIFYGGLSAGAIIGNVIIGAVMLANTSLRTVTNTFVMSLIVSDTLIATWNMPLQLHFYLNNEWLLGSTMCKLTSFVQGVSILVSILTLTAISVERYHVICNPIRARFIRSSRRALWMLIPLWLFAILLMLPHLWIQRLQQRLAWQHDSYPPIRIANQCVEHFPKRGYNITYTYSIFIMFYIVPVCVMLFTYGRMTRVLWLRTPISDSIVSPQLSDKRELQRKNIVRMLITMVVLFTICWLPFFILHIISLHYDVTYTLRVVQAFALLIGYSNSFFNPLIYFFLNAKFNRVFRNKLKRLNCVKPKKNILLRKNSSQVTEI